MKSRRSIISAVIAFLLMSVSLHAQNNNLGAAGIINEIKMSTDYIYAEATASEWREASDNATDILRRTLEDWLLANGVTEDVDQLMESKLVIRARRGTLYRAFLYIKKPEIASNQPAEVKIEQTFDVNSTIAVPLSSSELSQEEQKMLEVKRFDQIEPYVSALKAQNQILDYGKYNTLPDGPAYIFVYNRDGDVVATIKKSRSGQTNMSTGKDDDVSSYKGCGAIWFRFK